MSTLDDIVRGRLDGLPGADAAMAVLVAELSRLGAEDLSIARLLEPHLDAVRILAQADRVAEPRALYGVWASESSVPVRLARAGRSMALNGSKQFCSGAGICDRALVTARADDGSRVLVDVDLREGRRRGTIDVDPSMWSSVAFADTATWTVEFRHHVLGDDPLVGPPGFYLDRPGFWTGALGPVAVWVGGATGLTAVAEDIDALDGHQRAALGEMRALCWAMDAQLAVAAGEADSEKDDARAARRRALMMRHLVERGSLRVIELFGRCAGPRPMAFDAAVARRLQELALSVRQVHSGAELEELGGDDLGSPTSDTTDLEEAST